MKKIVLSLILLASVPISATDLNFSFIGNMQANYQKHNGTEVGIKEFELSWQSPLTENIQANVFFGIHGKDNGEFEAHPEEAYFNIINVPQDILGIKNNWGIGGKAGLKNLTFGKLNGQHPEQWKSATQPLAFTTLLGEESIRGTGGQLEWIADLPFFLQGEIGVWNVEREEENQSELVLKDVNTTARLWSSFSSSDSNEFELGLSKIIPNSKQNANLFDADLTFRFFPESSQQYLFRTEYLSGKQENLNKTLSGGYVLNSMKWTSVWETGFRYDWVNQIDEKKTQWAVFLTRSGSETSKTRFECVMSKEQSPTFIIQYIFGVGPHAHTIQ